MDWGVIDYNRCWPFDPITEGFDTSDGDACINKTFDHIGIESVTTVIKETKDIDLLALATRDLDSFANGLPTVRNTWSQRESGFVEIE